MSTGPPTWTINQVAEHLGVKPITAYRRLRRAGIKATRYESNPSGSGARALYDEQQIRTWHQAKSPN